jgi:oligoribonuclease NrnB/cAMP/cGMP phosphodiesterase (DHH superfamily)
LTLAILLGCSEQNGFDEVTAAKIEKLAAELQGTDINGFDHHVQKDPVQMIEEGFRYFKTNKFEYNTTRYAQVLDYCLPFSN